jgi:hypothetical protein
MAVLIKDANIRASGRDKIHNAFVRRPCVIALIYDLTNTSAGCDRQGGGAPNGCGDTVMPFMLTLLPMRLPRARPRRREFNSGQSED